jgi:hypothetical protein
MLLVGGSASAEDRRAMIILRLDYRGLSALVANAAGEEVYLREARRNRAGTKVFVNCIVGKGGAPKHYTATVGIGDVSLKPTPDRSLFHESGLLAYRLTSDSCVFGSGLRIPKSELRNVVSDPGATFILLDRGPLLWPSVAFTQTPTNSLFLVTNAFEFKKMYSDDKILFLLGYSGRGGSATANCLQYEEVNGEWLLKKTVQLPFAGIIYDMDPRLQRIIIAERSDFAPRCYEYDLRTGTKTLLGFPRQYCFYVERSLAEQVRSLQPAVVLLESGSGRSIK